MRRVTSKKSHLNDGGRAACDRSHNRWVNRPWMTLHAGSVDCGKCRETQAWRVAYHNERWKAADAARR